MCYVKKLPPILFETLINLNAFAYPLLFKSFDSRLSAFFTG